MDRMATTLNLVTERLTCSQPEAELCSQPTFPFTGFDVGRRSLGQAGRLGPGVWRLRVPHTREDLPPGPTGKSEALVGTTARLSLSRGFSRSLPRGINACQRSTSPGPSVSLSVTFNTHKKASLSISSWPCRNHKRAARAALKAEWFACIIRQSQPGFHMYLHGPIFATMEELFGVARVVQEVLLASREIQKVR